MYSLVCIWTYHKLLYNPTGLSYSLAVRMVKGKLWNFDFLWDFLLKANLLCPTLEWFHTYIWSSWIFFHGTHPELFTSLFQRNILFAENVILYLLWLKVNLKCQFNQFLSDLWDILSVFTMWLKNDYVKFVWT